MSMNVVMMICTSVSKCVTTLTDHTTACALVAMNFVPMDFHVLVRNYRLSDVYISYDIERIERLCEQYCVSQTLMNVLKI